MASESESPQPIDACELHARESQRLQPDRTPDQTSTPSEGTSQRECAEPVAWAVLGDGYEYVSMMPEMCGAWATENGGRTVPLYRSPTLTDEEREAIAWFAEAGKPLALLTRSHNREQYRATLRGLLERIK
jgi:hypothetical protein